MRVVSNTSPLCHAILLGETRLFPALFGEIAIPAGVAEELASEGAPQPVRDWIARPPGWLQVHAVAAAESAPGLESLHRGEREALVLALRSGASFVLLDERAARRAAEALGLRVMGLVGVLDLAARRGWLDFPSALDRLVATGFYLTPRLVEALVERHRSG